MGVIRINLKQLIIFLELLN